MKGIRGREGEDAFPAEKSCHMRTTPGRSWKPHAFFDSSSRRRPLARCQEKRLLLARASCVMKKSEMSFMRCAAGWNPSSRSVRMLPPLRTPCSLRRIARMPPILMVGCSMLRPYTLPACMAGLRRSFSAWSRLWMSTACFPSPRMRDSISVGVSLDIRTRSPAFPSSRVSLAAAAAASWALTCSWMSMSAGGLLRLREAQDHIGAARREGAEFPGEGLRGERRGRPLRGPHHGQRLPELRLLHRRGQALQRPGEYCSLAWRAHRPALAEIHRLRADARRAELEDASSAHGPRPAEAHKRITPLPHFCAHACPLSHELALTARDLQGFQPQLDRRAAIQRSAGPPQKLALEVHVYRGRRVPADFGDELLAGRDRMPEHLPQRGRSLLREGGERDRAGPYLAQLAERHLAEAADPVQRAHRAVQRCRHAPHELRAALEVCLAGQAHGLALPVASAHSAPDC